MRPSAIPSESLCCGNSSIRQSRRTTRVTGTLTPGGRRCRGNSWATQFWRGFDGLGENMWDAASTQSSGYIWWRAGREVGKALKKLEAEAVLKDEGDDRPFGP